MKAVRMVLHFNPVRNGVIRYMGNCMIATSAK
jgi:hypothetical protein